MKTKRLIDWLNSVPTWYESDGKILDEIIKRLEEYEELKACSIKGVDGKWVHVKDIQLLTNIVKE